MRTAGKYLLLFLLVIAAVWSAPRVMRAQSTNSAALVVRHGSDDVRTACVAFDEPRISGFELLQRSGADLQLDVQGIGALVCSIDDTGCPPNDCLCQCRGGGECVYWSYWHNGSGTWQYSQGGSSAYMVEPGAVEGWSWGPGAVNAAIPPPDLTFEDVCETSPLDTPTPTPSPTNTQPPLLITPGAFGTQSTVPAVAATSTRAISTNTATAQATAVPAHTSTPTAVSAESNAAAGASSTPRPTEVMVATSSPPAEAVVVQVATRMPQEATTQPESLTRIASREVKVTVQRMASSTPVAVAVAEEIEQDQAATPSVNARKKAGPTAQPTEPLQVVGADVVPTIEVDSGGSDAGDSRKGGPLNAETISYLVFLLIVAGLLGLTWFVSLRRRHQ